MVKAKICEFVWTQSGPRSLRSSTFTGARARRPLGYQIEREQYLQPGRRADTVISISEMTLEFTYDLGSIRERNREPTQNQKVMLDC